jgi:thymidylate synthase (FAD)
MNVSLVSKSEIDALYLESIINDKDNETTAENLPENLTEALVIYIARVTSQRKDKFDNYVWLAKYLIENKHWSPFEHSYVTMEIETSRAIGRQLIRHRSFTFQEFSQRYAKVSELEDIEFRLAGSDNRQSSVNPVGGINDDEAFTFSNATEEQKDAVHFARDMLNLIGVCYNELVEVGIATETARFVLPETTSTTIYMTGSLRSWLHFIQIRADEHSQLEIQTIANHIKDKLYNYYPNIINAFENGYS